MRIVIDMQGVQTESRFRGIGRYTLSLVQAVARNRGKHEVILALNGLFPDTIDPIRVAFDGLLPKSNICVWFAPHPLRECVEGNASNRDVAALIREEFLKSLMPDIIFISSFFEGYVDDAVVTIGEHDQSIPTVAILYDLIPLQNPETYLSPIPAYERYYRKKIENLKRAKALLCISNFTTKDGCKMLGMEQDSMLNISSACDPKFVPVAITEGDRKRFCHKYGIVRPFVLYAGGGDIRKNVHRLVRAYGQLPAQIRNKYQLTLAGLLSDKEIKDIKNVVEQEGLSKDELIFTGYVSDEDLVQLYNLCALFIFPSWYEGFGLPILEAMSCGAPVIAANRTSLPEIIEFPEAMFDPYSEHDMANKIQIALTDKVFRGRLVSNGAERANKFSWDQSARKAIAAFEHVNNIHQARTVSINSSKRRLKLAYISPLPPERSGIADYSVELLPELHKYYDIEVIVSQETLSDAWVNTNLHKRSVEWFRENSGEYDRVIYHIGNSMYHQHMFSLLSEVPGVVVLHDFFLGNVINYMDSAGCQDGIWTEKLYYSHGYKAVKERYQSPNILEVIKDYPCNLDILQHAYGVIVHSEHSVNLARKWYGEPLTHCWSVVPLLRQPSKRIDKHDARKKIGINQDEFIICSFGLLDPAKLNHRLLDAWLNSELAKNKSCRLIFVGENHGGKYGAELVEKINASEQKDRINITGWINGDDYRAYLSSADIAVQLRAISRGETSAAVLDCMNYGLTTIVNSKGSMAELPDKSVVKLPENFNDLELITALETFERDILFRQQVGTRARDFISTHHAPKFCAAKTYDSIESAYLNSSARNPTLIKALANVPGVSKDPKALIPIAESVALSFPVMLAPRQLMIDISALVNVDGKTGIERVVRSLLEELILSPPVGYRVEPVYAKADQGYRYARQFTLKFLNCPEVALTDELLDFKSGDIFLGLDLEPYIVQLQKEFYQKLRICGVQVKFIVYDLLPVLVPDVFPEMATKQHQKWLNIVAESDGAICISRSVANEFHKWLQNNNLPKVNQFQIDWIHLGADIRNSSPTSGVPKKSIETLNQIRARTSFLMVGTIEPRKGYMQALDAFTRLWQNGVDINLIIVGKEGWKGLPKQERKNIPNIIEKLKKHPELNNRLFWLNGISDEYLERVYGVSSCLIAASKAEGFGLPLIEAAIHSLPIIARDIPVFREVAQDNAYYFKGESESDLADSVQTWLKLYLKGEIPVSVNMHWNTWKQVTKKLYALLTIPNIEKKAMDDHLNLIHEARMEMVKTLLPQGDNILDLGGANCPLYKMGYPHFFKKLTLVDLPPDQRHDYYKDVEIDNNCSLGQVVVRYTDMTTLEGIADESIDFVWSGQSIEHVPLDAGKRMCQEVYRVLKKRGVFCLDTPNRLLTEIHTATIGGGYIHPEHCIEYYPDDLRSILNGVGFTIENTYGVCQMPETIASGKFHYKDFIFGRKVTEKVNEGYIQFFHCVK